MAKVSVIIPVYNGEKTIKRCIDSVTAQTLADIEIIVVNDGSADGTADIVKSLDDNRIRLFTVPNGGQGYARNKGMDASSGEYYAFVDADDEIEKDMLEKMYAAAKSSGADIVQCNIFDIYPGGGRVQLPLLDETVEIADRGAYTDKYFSTCRHSYEVCNKLIKKEAVGTLRFGDTKKYFSEDLLFNLELISRVKRVTFIADPLYVYYQSETSHLHKNADERLAGLRLLFRDYIASAPDDMKSAAAYTAAMVLSYSAADCAKSKAARDMLTGGEFKGYVREALKRSCGLKRRLFLTAMLCVPLGVKMTLIKMYGGREQK